MKPRNNNLIIRLLFSLLLIPIGAVMILLDLPGSAGSLVADLGLALIVAGVVSAFHETVLKRIEGGENAEHIAELVHQRIKEAPLSAIGIRLVSAVRKGYAGYYLWAMDESPEEMFFAGRSVLHRIDEDFRARNIGQAETLLARRLREGSSFNILFLDPRSEMIPRLAREEGQTSDQLLSDIATSLGICQRLYRMLENVKLPATSRLMVQVFDEVPYFAYHAVGDQVIVGFYFSSAVGHLSAAFEVVDPQTKEFFGQHFHSILGRSVDKYILRTHPHSNRLEINHRLLEELRRALIETLGEEKTTQKMAGG